MTGVARSGRFQTGLSPNATRFLSSLAFDWRLMGDDIDGSLAHVHMLKASRIISPDVAQRIESGLLSIKEDWEKGCLEPNPEWEDVHMNVEGRLNERIGPDAGYLHTARSRNDQVAVDMHLYMRREGHLIKDGLLQLAAALSLLAKDTLDVIMPGYTHLQPAQPVRMAHYWLSYGAMIQRDVSRLDDWAVRADRSPLGAGALAGTPYPTQPEMTRSELGFSSIYANSLDAVSDRDYLLEFLSWASIFMVHVSRMAEELVVWSTPAFGFVTLHDQYSTGSSIMPQKKNPDTAELLRGKSGRVVGHLTGLMMVMKGLPLAYNTDMQEDKEAVFDTVDTVKAVLSVLTGLLKTLVIHPGPMRQAALKEFSNATDLADRLGSSGMPFRQAHHRVGALVQQCVAQGYASFHDVPEDQWGQWVPEIPYAWLKDLTAEALVDARAQAFGTARDSVSHQWNQFQDWILQQSKSQDVLE